MKERCGTGLTALLDPTLVASLLADQVNRPHTAFALNALALWRQGATTTQPMPPS